MGKVFYIGSFPPPYGGVTVKNSLLFSNLSEVVTMKKIDLMKVKRGNIREIMQLAAALFGKDGRLVLGLSAGWRSRITKLLMVFNKNTMARSVVFVMGGAIPDSKDAQRLDCFSKVYVETAGMKHDFELMGANNVYVYPNCRSRIEDAGSVRIVSKKGNGLSCVYFSLISRMKGADMLLDVAEKNSDIEVHFYGSIDKEYERVFTNRISSMDNVTYHGYFDSVSNNPSVEMAKYDVHVFPTLCLDEGVPGVIVESKIAGIPTVATNRCRNAELIEDGVDGILLASESAECLSAALSKIKEDKNLLNSLKRGARHSAEAFYIDTYLEQLIEDIEY